jgi:RNA polymerase sigma-70 factor (ECF subfamily)
VEDAEDVLQDAFVRMWRVAEREPGLDLPNLAYAYTSIRRCAIDLARREDRRRRREDISQENAASHTWFSTEVEDAEQAAALEASLKQLPEKYREVITLKIWGDMTFQAIADMMGISINTVASRYRYGLQAMKNQLAKRKHELLP